MLQWMLPDACWGCTPWKWPGTTMKGSCRVQPLSLLRETEAELSAKIQELLMFDLGEPSFEQEDIEDLANKLRLQYETYIHLGMQVVELEAKATVLQKVELKANKR